MQRDFTVLQKVALFPELSTADAFAAARIDQVSSCGLRKTVINNSFRCSHPRREAQAKIPESLLQALIHLGVSLPSLTGWVCPDQGIGESARMQHGTASARASDQIQRV